MYVLGFDVMTTGINGTMFAMSFSLLDNSNTVINKKTFICIPDNKQLRRPLNVIEDYKWEKKCLEEFVIPNKELLNMVVNSTIDTIRLHEREFATESRKYFDGICEKYNPDVVTDNASFACFWISSLWSKYMLNIIDYQKNENGDYILKPVFSCSSMKDYQRNENSIIDKSESAAKTLNKNISVLKNMKNNDIIMRWKKSRMSMTPDVDDNFKIDCDDPYKAWL